MIITSNLSKTYNSNTVLKIDSLEVPKGQSFGLVGNNGAGKTTYFSLLLDLIQPTTGHIKNNDVLVNESEDWKPFTSAFIDETFLNWLLNTRRIFLLYWRTYEDKTKQMLMHYYHNLKIFSMAKFSTKKNICVI